MADVGDNSKAGLVSALNGALADTVALYFKTKNFHWHVAGPRFRDLHVLFDEQAAQLVGTVDDLGERVRKNDEYTLTSIGSVMKATRIEDQDDVTLTADAMVKELRDDNKKLHQRLGEVKEAAEEAGDNATSGVVDDWIDECEERIWFLNQTSK
ncbi:MAG: DNA starvation/stationary phase protection protein [Pseudomonadota bacterium]|jgi:starvation-inducible DNA-binding protein|uniref:DNA starvation/stationary phase protection protein n=1 Tax=Qipengyuania flava TaxID=192812 RepID=A0A222EYP0_9SPHN|nr:DNA starvation/stationary phase protection protein [Qipengyuania flava]KZX52952.1 DNA starvation/stationary phase protection protein [Erythrobacter sp. HI00D59]MEC7741065.1 DNA starvation/stationary phase protection protein [Pseudomonadota bacterium]OAN86447.1 DNA starvation/stationary phase protection protein [Erythrobacter sp. EhN03]HCS16807.1 DNA starvation/stationary phase protection protein [Erythrobacter sp.]ASP31143.1 DNA starvation/stationary phase protection protein [Qipengyuania f|tara:strand:+ start:78 stop:539 length:462 start_codon:yes stop_codon:yes gene_type:complete